MLEGPNDRYEITYRVVRENGDTSWVSARGTVERDAAGKAISLPGVVIDISELKATQQKQTISFRSPGVSDAYMTAPAYTGLCLYDFTAMLNWVYPLDLF